MSSEDLLSLKYSDLQKLAKSHGIKANQRSEKLIEALKSITENKSSKKANDADKIIEEDTQADLESESLNKATPKKRKRSSAGGTRQSSAKKSSKKDKSMMSTPQKVESPNEPSKRPPSPRKRATKKRTKVTSGNETISESTQHSSPATRNSTRRSSQKKENPATRNSTRRSSQKMENPATKPALENQEPSKKRRREESESEQVEPMKKRLRSSSGENVAEEKNDVAKRQQTSIPRYSKLPKVQKKTAEYWSKLHQKNNEKMESIDEYQKKKDSRAALLLSGRKGKVASGLRSPETRKSPRLTAVVKPLNSKVFVPEVLSTDKMDLNFGKKATAPRRRSAEKTLNSTFTKEASPGFKTPKNQKQSPKKDVASKNLMFSPKASNTSMMSATKHKFDLAASLDRPLTWVPYIGKVKPLRDETGRFREDVKEVKTKSKQERTAEARAGWRSKRTSELMRKRNIK